MESDRVIERLELGSEPQTVEGLRRLQAQMPRLAEEPRPERSEDRRSIDLPVHIAWETSDGRRHAAVVRAREIASASVYLELDPQTRLSSPELLLELEAGQEVSLCAVARVTRVEQREGKIGIAVVLEDYGFRPMPCPDSPKT